MEKIPPNLPFAGIGCINSLHRVGRFIRAEAASPREAEWASAAILHRVEIRFTA